MTREHFSRREFIGAAGLGIGLGMTLPGATSQAQQVYPSPQYPPDPPPEYPQLRVRPNIASLGEQQLAALKTGVSVMKSRPATDPTSWSFQANIHGTLGPVTSPLFNQCEHGTIQFLTWHRGYIYFFERILRLASGDPTLNLPYWDWTTAPALPSAYRSPADEASNPLYDGTRQINNGAQLPSSVVVDDLNTALGFIDFSTPVFTGFSPSLEGSPHGAVHTLIGGNMGFVPTAANDPIFWLHHCNIDRLWNRWLNQDAGRADPSDSAFLNQTYSYADENGQTVTLRVADMLTSAQLGYRYDSVPNPLAARDVVAMAAVAGAAGDPPAKEMKEVASSAPRGPGVAAAAEAEAKPLGYKEETVNLTVVAEAGPALNSAVATADAVHHDELILEIQGLSFEQPPEYTYEVLLNLPDQASAERARLHRVGTVNFFVGQHAHGAHAADGGKPVTFDQRFDITGLVSRLRESGSFDTENLTVTLRPISPIPPEGQEEEQKQRATASAEKAGITYQRINILVKP